MWLNIEELNKLIDKAKVQHKYQEAMALVKLRDCRYEKALYYVADSILDNIA